MPGSGYNLTEAQEAAFQKFAGQGSDQWPLALLAAVDAACQRLGKCGEVCYDAIAGYVRETVR